MHQACLNVTAITRDQCYRSLGAGTLAIGGRERPGDGVRRKRHGADFRDAILSDQGQLSIQIDADTDRQAWGATLRLAARHQLTIYDAAYLELALRRGLALATLDTHLRQAGLRETLTIMG